MLKIQLVEVGYRVQLGIITRTDQQNLWSACEVVNTKSGWVSMGRPMVIALLTPNHYRRRSPTRQWRSSSNGYVSHLPSLKALYVLRASLYVPLTDGGHRSGPRHNPIPRLTFPTNLCDHTWVPQLLPTSPFSTSPGVGEHANPRVQRLM